MKTIRFPGEFSPLFFGRVRRLFGCSLFLILFGVGRCAEVPALAWPEAEGVTIANQQALTTALLAGNWQETAAVFAEILPRRNATNSTTPYNFLAGLAFLATGRDTDTLVFLQSSFASRLQTRAAWETWTREQLARQPSNPTLLFLVGDALARNGRPAARAQLAQAITAAGVSTATCGLAQNALGLLLALEGNGPEAQRLLAQASGLEGFGDPWVNQGILAVRFPQKNLPTEAVAAFFKQALKLNPNNAYALSGLDFLHEKNNAEYHERFIRVVGTYREKIQALPFTTNRSGGQPESEEILRLRELIEKLVAAGAPEGEIKPLRDRLAELYDKSRGHPPPEPGPRRPPAEPKPPALESGPRPTEIESNDIWPPRHWLDLDPPPTEPKPPTRPSQSPPRSSQPVRPNFGGIKIIPIWNPKGGVGAGNPHKTDDPANFLIPALGY